MKAIFEEHDGYGTWESRCKSYGIDPRTARNYMRDAREADKPAPITSENISELVGDDLYGKEVAEAIAKEKDRREQRRRKEEVSSGGKVKLHVTLLVTKDQEKCFKVKTKREPSRTQKIFQAAFLEIIEAPAPTGNGFETMPADAVQNPTFPDQFEVPLEQSHNPVTILPDDYQPTDSSSVLPVMSDAQAEAQHVTA